MKAPKKKPPSHSDLDGSIICCVATNHVKYHRRCSALQSGFGRAVNLSITWIKPTPILNLPQEMKKEEEDVPLRLVSLIAFPILTTDGGWGRGGGVEPKGYQMKKLHLKVLENKFTQYSLLCCSEHCLSMKTPEITKPPSFASFN